MSVALWVSLVFIFLPIGSWALVCAAERARKRERWVRPAAQILIDNLPKSGAAVDTGMTETVALSVRESPEKYIKLPPVFPIDPTDLESCVTVRLPVSPGSNDKARDRIVLDIGQRLGFGSTPTAEWSYTGHGATVRLFPTPSFGEPRTVYDYMPHVEALDGEPLKVLLGLDIEGNPVVYDHVVKGPHLKASAGSGGGKSNLYRFLVPQYIRKGAQVVILDVKGVSMLDLAVALEFKNIRYYSETETCHNAFQAVFAELERRRKEDIAARLRGERVTFTPLHVVMEEANTLMAMLKDFWEYAKKLQAEAAVHSPAIRSMHYSVYMGREFGIYLHVICQRAEAAVFGGGAVRENFNAAIMSKWDKRTWTMLAHGHKYIPHPMDWSWYLVTSTEVTRYLPPVLQESDAALLADLDKVEELPWSSELEAVPDVRVTSVEGYLPTGGLAVAGIPHIELSVTLTLDEACKLLGEHGHSVPLSTMKQWQAKSRSATVRGYSEWPEPVGTDKGNAKVYKRTDVLTWMMTGPDPDGKYWDGVFADIQRRDCDVRHHVIYGHRVEGFGDRIAYVGQTHQALETRTSQHEEDQYWGDQITDTVTIFEGEMTCIEARKIEGMLTEILGCALNRPIPQVGTEPRPKWNPAGTQAETLRDARHARDTEAGRQLFVAPRDRVNGTRKR